MPVLSSQSYYYGGKQLPNPVQGLSGTGAPPSIVPAEAIIGQTTYTRTSTQTVYMLTSKSPVTWTVLGDDTGSFSITPYVVGPAGQAGYQTVQAAITAASAAGGGTVYVQNGTYTENLTCADNVQVVGVSGFRDNDGAIIVGVHTPPATGNFSFINLTLQSATHIFSSVAAGTAHLIIANCNTVITTGYTYNLLNWTGILEFYNTDSAGTTTDGGVNNTGGATVYAYGAGVGGGTANSMIVTGPFLSSQTNFYCPVNPQTGAIFALDQASFVRTFTASNDSTGTISNSYLNTGATAAVTMSSSAAVSLLNSVVTSSNNPAIAGAGAGTFTLGDVTFTSNSSLAGTLTLAYAASKLGATIMTGNSSVVGTLQSSGNLSSSAGSVTAATTLTATLGAITATNGNFVKGTAGNKDIYSSVATNGTAGANSAGSATLAGGTVTIATTAVTANSLIRIYRQAIGSTGAAALGILSIGTITPATSFVIRAVQAADATALQASDVSVVFWEIVN